MKYIVVRPDTTVEQIRGVIEEEKLEMFPIVSRDDIFLGYILKGDVISTYPAGTTAVEVFKDATEKGEPRALFVHTDDTADKAEVAMDKYHLPFLAVVKPDGRFVGAVDRIALANAARVSC